MSAGGGGRDDGPPDEAEDPFAFPPDSAEGAGDRPAADDPFSFPADDGPAGAHADTSATSGRARRKAPVPRAAAAAEVERVARLRRTADEAAAHARAVGGRWLLVAIGVFVALVVLTTLTGGRDGRGGDVRPGERLPVFAAPLATAPPLGEYDQVNLATEDGQGEAGEKAACSIRNPSVVTSCALLARGPLVLVVFSRGVDACVRAVDELERQRRRFPRVQALAVSLLGHHDSTGDTVRDRGWTMPVVYDRDGALGQVLGAPACPLVLFVRADGTVAQRIIGRLEPGALASGMRRLLAPGTPSTTTVDATPPGR